jgi:hypothetical protein
MLSHPLFAVKLVPATDRVIMDFHSSSTVRYPFSSVSNLELLAVGCKLVRLNNFQN